MNNVEILSLAFALSLLGYTVGTLLIGMPLPFPTLKRLGPALMKDSVFSLIMIALSSTIISIPVILYERLGLSWNHFDKWIAQRGLTIVSWKGGLIAASSFLARVTGEVAVESFLEPLSKSVNYSLLTLYAIFTLSIMVRYHYAKLILLGILLSSVPFKLSRWAGCYLIAFSVVFYVGMPLLPSFVDTYSSPIEEPKLGEDVIYASIKVLDAMNRPVPYVVITGRSLDGSLTLFRYTTGVSGIAGPKSLADGLPRGAFILEFEVLGEKIEVQDSYVNLTDYIAPFGSRALIVFTLRNVYVIDDRGVYVYDPNSVLTVLEESGGSRLKALARGYSSFFLLRPLDCEVFLENAQSVSENQTSYGSYYVIEEIVALDVDVPVDIHINECKAVEIDVYEPYNMLTSISAKDRLALLASQMILNYIVLPSAYLAILFTISSTLASLLSGMKGQLPLKLW